MARHGRILQPRKPRFATDTFLVATIQARRRVARWPRERQHQHVAAELQRLREQRVALSAALSP